MPASGSHQTYTQPVLIKQLQSQQFQKYLRSCSASGTGFSCPQVPNRFWGLKHRGLPGSGSLLKMEIFHSVFLVLSSMCISYSTPIMENMYSYSNARIGQETYVLGGNYPYHDPFKEQQQHDTMRHWDERDNQAPIILDSQPVYLAPSESMKDYPSGAIRRFLTDNPRLTDYFKEKMPHIGMRNGLPEEEEEGQTMCKIRESKVIFPQLLQNIGNFWRIVINIEGEYEQGVEIKTCYRKGEECDNLKSLPFGYTSFCSQQYITKELMIFNYSKAFDLFRFPSCCLCKLKRP